MTTPRIAFVTGGAGGIGSAICKALAEAGNKVAVADLASDAADRVAAEIDALPVTLDVTDPVSVEQAVRQTQNALGPIDILVNCAGWDEFKPFVDTDDAFTAKVLEINFVGPLRLTRALLPPMIDRKWGRVINIASDAGRVGSSLEAVYSGAKGGLIAFTKTIAREVAHASITANSVCPGPTQTPFLHRVAADAPDAQKVLDAMTRAVPMRRLGSPQDVAPLVAFLASENARFITGQTISASGGLTMA